MSLIQMNNITFGYDGSAELVFEDLNLSIDTDWKLGFIGRNGRGKTTLLQLLLGKHEYRGSIQSPVPFEYFPFPIHDPQQMGLDIAEELLPQLEEWKLHREINLLDLSSELLYRPFATLSGGEQTKLLLAILFLKEHHFLLIDEPTNHLDAAGRQVVSGYLNSKKGFLLVSHDRAFLDGCVDHILSLNKGGIELQRGDYSSWEENRRRQDQFEVQQNQRLEKDVARLAKAASRTAGWSDTVEKTKYATRDSGLRPDRGFIGHKSAKMMKRAKAADNRRQTALEEKSALLQNIERNDNLTLTPLSHPKQLLVELIDLTIQYQEGATLFEPLTLRLYQGERIALVGPNGSGKSSLFKLLLGEAIPYQGTLRLASGLIISHVSQQTGHLTGDLQEYAQFMGIDLSQFMTILRKFGFERATFEYPMEQYSEGQKKKVLLACSLCQQAHLYLWDEPLNYVDLLSRLQLEELLLASDATVLLVEHDRTFTEHVATQQITLIPTSHPAK